MFISVAGRRILYRAGACCPPRRKIGLFQSHRCSPMSIPENGALMPRIVLATLFFLATALPAAAQNSSATARLGAGQTATITAVRATGEPARLEIALPKGTQRFDGIGEQFLSIKSGGKDSVIVIADLNGDGVDEIV